MNDYHVHSNYSDGSPLLRMAEAAADAGLEGVGFADHCNVSDREQHREVKFLDGFNLDLTYSRRRKAIDALRDRVEVEVYDAVEVDYEPDEEEAIRAFLDKADFDYALGSVHYLLVGDRFETETEDEYVGVDDEAFAETLSPDERRAFVDAYYDAVEALIRSELFEVVAHLDFFEANAVLRGLTTEAHHDQIADALADSRTIPELNAGFVGEWGDYGEFFPAPAFVDALVDRGVDVTVGTDSHNPEEFERRAPELAATLEARGLDPVSPFDVPARSQE